MRRSKQPMGRGKQRGQIMVLMSRGTYPSRAVEFRGEPLTKSKGIMKDFLEIMGKDIMDEHFTRKEFIIYGIITPIVLIAIMALAGWMETM